MKFRPQYFPKSALLKMRRRGHGEMYHFRPRSSGNSTAVLNRAVIRRIFGRVHYIIDHAPERIQKQNKNLEIFWNRKMYRRGLKAFDRSIHVWL